MKQNLQYKTYLNMRLEVVRDKPVKYIQCSSSEAIFNELKDEYNKYPNEVSKCIHLTTKNHIIGIETIAIGTLTCWLSTFRDIFKGAIINNSSSIVITHNHPSGDPNPSKEDKNFTDSLVKFGEFVGITVLDHIIFGTDNYYSFGKDINLKRSRFRTEIFNY